ncbi:hypothetical protein MMC22_002300 [Lobaria immixta]|nr:hypothetical protein [Lobaria immixta]
MSISRVFKEDFYGKPSAATEKLYAKSAGRDHIFQEGDECHIDAHYCLLNPQNDRRIQNETQLAEFCEESKDHRRLFFIDSKISRARLLVSRELFDRLIEICEVFQTFREFVVSFGPVKNDEPHEYRSPQHVHRKISHTVSPNTAGIATVATSKKFGFEFAYEIRYVAEKPDHINPGKNTWVVRQMAIYHGVRMDNDQITLGNSIEEGTLQSTLIALCAPQDMKARLRRYNTEIDVRNESWSECFEIHLLILHEFLGTWRPYLRWLTLELTDSTRDAILADSRVTGREVDARMQSQKLKGIQDDIENGILNLESLLDTTDSLARSYERHARKDLKDWDALDDDIMQAFREKSRLAALIKHNFYALREKGNSTANLYSRVSEVQAAENAERNTESAMEESKSLKVLSFFTVFYLPTSILGNFFSSSFVEVSIADELRHRMVTVENWWVYWVVITCFTFATVIALNIYGDILNWWDIRWIHRSVNNYGRLEKYRWFRKRFGSRQVS